MTWQSHQQLDISAVALIPVVNELAHFVVDICNLYHLYGDDL
jgi:hypothetical protein